MPFCRRKCFYCNFYSDIYNENIAASYIDALSDQINKLDGKFTTIYIGGGTPTVIEKPLLEKLFKNLKGYPDTDSEFTIEANPESLNDEKIKLLLDSGVNRISIGAQSLRDEKLKALGRIHDSKAALDSVYRAAKRGFKNISVDLIFGVWNDRMDTWEKEIGQAAGLPVTHISCYELTYEKDTPLFNALKNKSILPLEDDDVVAMYEKAIDLLALGGFKQYEISNFSKEGYGCRHNLNYWENNLYIGLGASAFSYIDGTRTKNIADISEYIRRSEDGVPLIGFTEKLSPIRRARETAAVKIRTKEGIDFNWFEEKTGYDFMELEKKAVQELLQKDLIKYRKDKFDPTGICLKRKGFLFCDTVSSTLL